MGVGNAVSVVEGIAETGFDEVETLTGAEGGIVGLQATTKVAPRTARLTARAIERVLQPRIVAVRRVASRVCATWSRSVRQCHSTV